ncbi:CocE/NonD family hydrolase [Agromyces bauzanensis]|uniref:X-Pro dipeptidyl-peptidase n=1 Tax=Agromyces bauzanensis TaxID=1308924 RepID=A0A917PLU2_9MICO|nr:CocE/NonD family hydrolase [Agromyces bauzanensis]GGJ83471.1 X-Pro dipeptidyl-peptidase [Agromyces bauzanensis]
MPDDANDVRVAMRDGTELATDLYLPDRAAPAPAMLVRIPYDKDGESAFLPEIARAATARGYAAVMQDVRGRYRSDGAPLFGVHEALDGYDTIEWIIARPWSDGSVVMWGDSYFGLTALAAASTGHPALRAIAPRVTGTQLGRVLEVGVGVTDVEQSSFRELLALYFATHETIEWPVDWSARPLAAEFERCFEAIGTRSESYDREVRSPGGLTALRLEDLLSAPPVPILFTAGWFDAFAAWSWHDLAGLRSHAGWAEGLRMRLEAIDHHNGRFAEAFGGASAAPSPVARVLGPALDFFDDVLGRPGTMPTPRVAFEVCYGDWGSATSWPPEATTRLTLHGAVAGSSRAGALTVDSPAEPGELRWSTDGVDPVPSVSSDPYRMLTTARDLARDALRPDVASLDSAPFPEGVTLLGPIDVTAELRTDAHLVDLFARLLDVAPSGWASLIARGQVRVRMDAAPRSVRIDLQHVAYRVRPGHRLRLHLASGDFPQFMFLGSDGTSGWDAERGEPATVSLPTWGEHGLRLTVSIEREVRHFPNRRRNGSVSM